MTNYRKLWKKHYGDIPKDENGNSYDIHHIDGDRNNNDLSNLKAVSIKEHYEIHYKQGDWFSAILISKRLNISSEEREYLREKIRKKMQESNPMKKEENKIKLRKPKPPGFGEKISLLKKGISIATKGIKKGPQEKVTCPHCNKIGGINNMITYHFDNCKIFTGKQKYDYRKKQSEALQCPHCGLIGKGGGGAMKQWHFDNCKKKESIMITSAHEKASKLYTDAYTRWCYELSHEKNYLTAKDICLYICSEVLGDMGTDDREAYEILWWSEVKTILEKSNHNDLYGKDKSND